MQVKTLKIFRRTSHFRQEIYLWVWKVLLLWSLGLWLNPEQQNNVIYTHVYKCEKGCGKHIRLTGFMLYTSVMRTLQQNTLQYI